MKKLYITPKGNRIIVEQVKLEEVTESGIIIKRANEMAEQANINKGTILAISPDSWDDWSEPFAKVGDVIYFSKHAGKKIIDPVTEEEYLIMMDIDVLATIDKENKYD
jgi:co-chaperonin GroES (HSP10)